MSVSVAAASCLLPGDGPVIDSIISGNMRGGGPAWTCELPGRPQGVASGAWRRLSRLGKLVCHASIPLLEGRSDLHDLAVVFGTVFGELEPTGRFLDRMHSTGTGSPLAFQNSVYNAPVGHVSNMLGLRGPSETISAGGVTSLCALARAIDLLHLGRAPAVLVVVGDVLSPGAEQAWRFADTTPVSESISALLVHTGPGASVDVQLGAADSPSFAQTRGMPGSGSLPKDQVVQAVQHSLGHQPSPGLALLASGFVENRAVRVTEFDGSIVWNAHIDTGKTS